MRISSLLCLAALFAGSGSLVAAPADPASDMKAKFNVSEQTEIPGMVLKPGAYSIRVVDHLSDRLIMRVDGPSGDHSTFIGLSNGTVKGAQGIVPYGAGPDGQAAAKGFSFPGGKGVEFVYPKAEAVSLAKLNGTSVVAIDPASEGRVANATTGLSKDDMEVVTLWTLSSTKVGPDIPEPAIKAERYKNQQVASVHKPVIARLPHTASYLPVWALLSLLSLMGAGMVRVGRYSLTSNR